MPVSLRFRRRSAGVRAARDNDTPGVMLSQITRRFVESRL
jgi:hypothetical protein